MTYRDALRIARAEYLRSVLAVSSSVAEAAERAGLNRPSFYRVCARHGVAIPKTNRGSQRERCLVASEIRV